MGLDMYLEKEIFIRDNKYNVVIKKNGVQLDTSKVTTIKFEVGYWRKANHIHNWFVENVQDGTDDCERYYVNKEHLQKLLNTCKEVVEKAKLEDGKTYAGTTYLDGEQIEHYENGKIISNVNEIAQLLPTKSGFFFGSEQYDGFYLESVKETIQILEPLLEEDVDDWTISYHYTSSW